MDQASSASTLKTPGEDASDPAKKAPRIAIFVVTYNAANSLRSLLDRIPTSVWERVDEVFVFDDESQDDTFLVGLGYKVHNAQPKLSVFRNEKNLGYGGNQIRGYKYAIDKGYDIVALLHGDGQYAPEALPELLAPLERGEADAVFGSRMIQRGAALEGGMPLYKYVGNKILTAFENAALGMNLSEFHSGYRIYSTAALAEIPFEKNTHDFHFDTQIIIQLHEAGKRILEVPIPTYYGDEICYVNGMKYARDVVRSVGEYHLHRLGMQRAAKYEIRPSYEVKGSRLASHHQLAELVGPTPRRILDLGCGRGRLAEILAERGHQVVGVDVEAPASVSSAIAPHLRFEFVAGDLARGLPAELEGSFDVILLADVLEHLPDPRAVLVAARQRLAPGGRLLVSLPNAVHWSVRAQVAMGRFEYTNEGLLDRGHLRFFTRRSAAQMFEEVGLHVEEHRTTPVPWEKVFSTSASRVIPRVFEKADRAVGGVLPNLFAYQNIFVLRAG
jgi:2-polyprenyl-3-methyl-5-hydroxy-6-metoxy-1,4-benzoquinol methylase/GT2 family glycosyltransferase